MTTPKREVILTSPLEFGSLTSGLRETWAKYGTKFSWALISSAILQVQSIVLMVITARTLSSGEFGKYALLLTTISAVVSVAGLSLGMTATRCVATNLGGDLKSVATSLALCKSVALVSSFGAAILLAVAASFLSQTLVNKPELTLTLRYCAPFVFFMTLNGFQSGALAGFLAFRQMAEINIIQMLVAILLTAGLTLRFGLNGSMAGLVLSSASTWLHTDFTLRRVLKYHQIKLDYRGCLTDHRPLTEIALPASIAGMIGSVSLWGLTVISSKQTHGILVVGAFAIAANFRLASLFVPVIYQRVLSAHLARAEYRENPPAYRRLYWRGVGGSVLLAISAATVILMAHTPLLRAFGRAHEFAGSFLVLLLASGVLESYGTAVYLVIATTASLVWHVCAMSVWAPTLIGVGWFCAQKDRGVSGMALALLAAWFMVSCIYTAIAMRLLGRLNPL